MKKVIEWFTNIDTDTLSIVAIVLSVVSMLIVFLL